MSKREGVEERTRSDDRDIKPVIPDLIRDPWVCGPYVGIRGSLYGVQDPGLRRDDCKKRK